MAEFSCTPRSVKVETYEENKLARFYFEPRVNGKPVTLPNGWLTFKQDDLQLDLRASAEENFIRTNTVRLYNWGWTEAKCQAESDELTGYQGKLEKLLVKAAQHLIEKQAPPSTCKDLLTGLDYRRVIEMPFAFEPARTVKKEREIIADASLYFSSLYPIPRGQDPVLIGLSKDCLVQIGCHADQSRIGGQLVIRSYGTSAAPALNPFSKAQINEALQDLANQLAQQARPADHVLLLPVTSTRLEPLSN